MIATRLMRPSSSALQRPVEARLVSRDDDLRDVVADAERAHRVAVDVEASGMFAYRATPCTVQLAWDGGTRVAIVDALAASTALLGGLLGPEGPVKVVHDVAFDSRLLAESGIALGNVHDTAVAARMLSRPATGLATLLDLELGVHIAKTMQQHDWRIRPLDDAMLGYLAADVTHLEALEEKLWTELLEHGIEDAVLEETTYRIASAIAASRPSEVAPPYTRVKGTGRLTERELAALRVAAELREREAQRRDVPPHKVASADALIAIARTRPTTSDELARIRGLSTSTPEGLEFAASILRAIPTAADVIPEEERVHFEVVRMPPAEARLRRQREARLIGWRRAEAKRRGVDEQVILPGHCLKDAVDSGAEDVDDLFRVPGIGAFRVRRDGAAIVNALRGQGDDA
jgi:ribonuclease D